MMPTEPCKVVVLIGGNGSNLQAIIDKLPSLNIELVAVISHRPEVYGLERAAKAELPTFVIDHTEGTRKDFELKLKECIQSLSPDLIVMAGFMRLLSPEFVQCFARKIINIHPSLLPLYKGLNTHERVLEAGDPFHGVSVHFVTEELDGGPIIAQVTIPVLPADDVASLKQRIHHAEHWLYPQIIDWFAQKRLQYSENIVTLDGKRLGPRGRQLNVTSGQGMIS